MYFANKASMLKGVAGGCSSLGSKQGAVSAGLMLRGLVSLAKERCVGSFNREFHRQLHHSTVSVQGNGTSGGTELKIKAVMPWVSLLCRLLRSQGDQPTPNSLLLVMHQLAASFR